MSVLFACLSMALKDALGTWLTVAEARGREFLAGLFDALFDLATIFTTVYGAGFVLKHGWSLGAVGIIGAMTLTSFAGTMMWTRMSKWMMGVSVHKHKEIIELQDRVVQLEAKLVSVQPTQ